MEDLGSRLTWLLTGLTGINLLTYLVAGSIYHLHIQLVLVWGGFLFYFYKGGSSVEGKGDPGILATGSPKGRSYGTVALQPAIVLYFVLITAFFFYARFSEKHGETDNLIIPGLQSTGARAVGAGAPEIDPRQLPCSPDGATMRDANGTFYFCVKRRNAPEDLWWKPAVHPGVDPGKERVAMCSAHGDTGQQSYAEMATMSEINKQMYAELHGYACYFDDDLITADMNWNKKSAIRTTSLKRHLVHHEYVYWTDVDVVITNPAQRVENIVKMRPDAEVILTKDWGGGQVNPGSIIIHRSDWSTEFIRLWEDAIARHDYHDDLQGLRMLLSERPDIAEKVAFVPQFVMNSYPHLSFENKGYTPEKLGKSHDFYEDNDFAVHVVNCIRAQSRDRDPITCVGMVSFYVHIFRMKLHQAWLRRVDAFAGGRTLNQVWDEEAKTFLGRQVDPYLYAKPELVPRQPNKVDPCANPEGIKPFWVGAFRSGFQRVKPTEEGAEFCVWQEVQDGEVKYSFDEWAVDPTGQFVIMFSAPRSMFVRLTPRLSAFSNDRESWSALSIGKWGTTKDG